MLQHGCQFVCFVLSNIHFVILGPLLHGLDHRLGLRIAGVSQKQKDFAQRFPVCCCCCCSSSIHFIVSCLNIFVFFLQIFLPWLVSGNDELKCACTGASLSLPVLRIRVHSLHQVERSRRIVEVSHLLTHNVHINCIYKYWIIRLLLFDVALITL